MMRTTGLAAGDGALPIEIAKSLHRRGKPPVIFALSGNCKGIDEYASDVVRISEPRLDLLAAEVSARGVDSIILAGRVPKSLMFRPELMDESLRSLLAALPVRDDHSLLGAIVAFLESKRIEVLSYKEIVPELMAPSGAIAGREPTASEIEDISYGAGIAAAVVPLSFGQTVIVRGRSVVAVEAMEGTDAAIGRAGHLAGGGVVVKLMRPDQDERFDLPTVGTDTLKCMKDAGMSCLAVEAGRTIILGGDLFRERAGSWGIAVTGITPDHSS